nr:MAG TPA: hypothetical protein [Caudoviricetes sp.]
MAQFALINHNDLCILEPVWSKYAHRQMRSILQNQESRSNLLAIASSPSVKSSHPPLSLNISYRSSEPRDL